MTRENMTIKFMLKRNRKGWMVQPGWEIAEFNRDDDPDEEERIGISAVRWGLQLAMLVGMCTGIVFGVCIAYSIMKWL